jgi:hypothetical protein
LAAVHGFPFLVSSTKVSGAKGGSGAVGFGNTPIWSDKVPTRALVDISGTAGVDRKLMFRFLAKALGHVDDTSMIPSSGAAF